MSEEFEFQDLVFSLAEKRGMSLEQTIQELEEILAAAKNALKTSRIAGGLK